MNWKSKEVSEVAKERIWKEHVLTESQHRVVFDTYRVNPARMVHSRPVTESINKRPARFLDRDAALIEAMTKRGHGVQRSSAQSSVASSPRGTAAAGSLDGTLPQLTSTPRVPHPPVPSAAAATGSEPTTLPAPPSGATGGQKAAPPPLSPRDVNTVAHDDFATMFTKVHLSPTKKYASPQTSSQELGWILSPLMTPNTRFQYGHKSCEITRFQSQLMLHAKRAGAAAPASPGKH